ncbi:GNAT family N-acetyltransferase [uncultured Roseovarius sp.]|uniref:GNAT family N-acetyltransferase n=1 Tax=uncultured Roseovarius sp. TaxID=293344 RepID=UPI002620B7FA|nr:GNAT family N-acetyltransferase [uncultured Roseovarius sp.]
MIRFREATRDDVPAVIALLVDDVLGQSREDADISPYLAAFGAMQAEGGNQLIVGETENKTVVATYQLTFISGLSLRAARRAQVESVRVASHLRGQGIGEAMFIDADARARVAGCSLMQLTMNATRIDSHRFYERLGFQPTHTGFKRVLD